MIYIRGALESLNRSEIEHLPWIKSKYNLDDAFRKLGISEYLLDLYHLIN